MKLLLTSAGIKNKTIADALMSLLEKSLKDVKIGFIPTASNIEPGNKDWFIAQFTNLYRFGFEWIDVVDISAPEVDWKSRLELVDIVLVCGGNTFHLLDQVRKTKFDAWLQENIASKVYVGISAGSIIMTPKIAIAGIDNGDENIPNLVDFTGLGFVDFEVSPHTPENVSHEGNKHYKATTENELYGIDDQTAILVTDDRVEVVSEGKWLKY